MPRAQTISNCTSQMPRSSASTNISLWPYMHASGCSTHTKAWLRADHQRAGEHLQKSRFHRHRDCTRAQRRARWPGGLPSAIWPHSVLWHLQYCELLSTVLLISSHSPTADFSPSRQHCDVMLPSHAVSDRCASCFMDMTTSWDGC